MALLPPPPPTFQLRPVLELRTRADRRLDRDFCRQSADGRNDVFFRRRVGVQWSQGPWSGALIGQSSSDDAFLATHTSTDLQTDLRHGFVTWTGRDASVTGGRQGIRLGFGRLLNEADWNNVGVVFDGLRVQFGRWDGMVGQVGYSYNCDHQTRMNVLATRSAGVELLFLGKHQPNRHLYTLDLTHRTKFGPVLSEFELAGQAGSNSGASVHAWAGFERLTVPLDRTTSLALTGALASGGREGETFDQVFGAYQWAHGVSGLTGWRNCQILGLTAKRELAGNLVVSLSAFRFGLADARDAWYSGSGGINRGPSGQMRDPTGRSGRELGSEIGLCLDWKQDSQRSLAFGIAQFAPGRFVRRQVAEAVPEFYGYVMSTYRF